MNLKFCGSCLLVKDIKKSRDFYEGVLQQTVVLDHGACVSFGGFSIWEMEYAYKIMGLSLANGDSGKKDIRFELYFETENLDDVHEKLCNLEFVHELFEQPWGQRVFRVYDPDRHMVEIGEPMPVVIQRFLAQGMIPAEVAKRTAMPLELVQQVADVTDNR